jgi:hypothetical protein
MPAHSTASAIRSSACPSSRCGRVICAAAAARGISGYLDDGWQGITFTPMGTDPVTGIANLPAWDPQHKQVYRDMINRAAGSLDGSRTARLEAVIPYLDQGTVAYNTVRLFYLEKAVQGGADLVVVRIKSLIGVPGGVQGRQDGNGQGPPH